jgi:hypothetical protein
MDMDMPFMGGHELCQNIAVERPGIKVLLMSGGVGAKRTGPHKWVTLLSEAVHCHGPAGFHQNAAGSNAAHEGKMISVNYCRDHLASTYRYT